MKVQTSGSVSGGRVSIVVCARGDEKDRTKLLVERMANPQCADQSECNRIQCTVFEMRYFVQVNHTKAVFASFHGMVTSHKLLIYTCLGSFLQTSRYHGVSSTGLVIVFDS